MKQLLFKNLKRIQTTIAVFLVISMTFFGWPPLPFLPKVPEAYAAIPTFVNAGAVDASGNAITPGLPASIAANDIILLFLETENEAISISSAGDCGTWAETASSPQGTGVGGATDATRITVFWCRYDGSGTGGPTTTDSGDHQLGRTLAFRGVRTTGDPWDVTSGGTEALALDSSGTIPGATTTMENILVVAGATSSLPDSNGTAGFSAWANADLGSVAEQTDNTTNAGTGGGLGTATGTKATEGAYGDTTYTTSQNSAKAHVTIALKGPPIEEQLHYRWRNDDGSETGATAAAAEDTALTGLVKNTNIRLRFLVTNPQSSTGSFTYRLDWAARVGATCDTDETYSDVSAGADSEPFEMTATANYADGDNSTNAAGVLSDPANTAFTAGKLVEDTSNTTAGITLEDQFTEIEYNFVADNDSAFSRNYCFRLSNAGTALNTYTVYAAAQIEAAPNPTTDELMRHGNWFASDGSEQRFFWAD